MLACHDKGYKTEGTSMQSLPITRAGIGGTERKMEDFHNNKLHN